MKTILTCYRFRIHLLEENWLKWWRATFWGSHTRFVSCFWISGGADVKINCTDWPLILHFILQFSWPYCLLNRQQHRLVSAPVREPLVANKGHSIECNRHEGSGLSSVELTSLHSDGCCCVNTGNIPWHCEWLRGSMVRFGQRIRVRSEATELGTLQRTII